MVEERKMNPLRSCRYLNSRLEEMLEEEERMNNIGNGEDQEIIVPNFNLELYPHQKTTIFKMEKVEREKKLTRRDGLKLEMNMSILGDIPGYGKSFSFLGLIARDKMEWNIDTKFEYDIIEEMGPSSTYKLKTVVKKDKLDCSLLVVSNSIIGQWENELKKTKIKYFIFSKKKQVDVDPNEYDLIVVSSTMYNILVKEYSEFAWKRFAFDEAASTHIPNMHNIYAGFYWFITATFPSLDKISGRNTHFLKSIFSRMSVEVFQMMLIKNSNFYVTSSFSMPRTRIIEHECLESNVVRFMRHIVDGDIQEMLGAGNIEGAIRHLNGGEMKEGNLVEIVLSKKMDELQKANEHLRYAKKNLKKKNNKEHRENVEKWEKKVKEITDTLNSIKERFNNALEDDCTICQSTLDSPIMLRCCQNMYCNNCISGWIRHKNSCPMCRSIINEESIIKINGYGDMNIEEENEKKLNKVKIIYEEEKYKWRAHEKMSKPDTIGYILNKIPKGKVIIFSNHDVTFQLIKNKLDELDIKCVEIKGSKETREKKLNSYKNGDINVIFLNSKFNGAGINLQITTDIILYHDMEEHIVTQVMGRANRIGRTEELTIHKLI